MRSVDAKTLRGRWVRAVSADAVVPTDATVIDVRRLMNPFSEIRNGKLEDSLDAIEAWMRRHPRTESMLEKFVRRGLNAQGDVYVRCRGGKHRSQVVARLIQQREGLQQDAGRDA